MTEPSAPPSTTHASFEELIARVGVLAGAAAGTVGFIYVVGGAVMWLRFWRADLPADQALALVPRSDLLVVGMRVMILPALAAGGLFLLLAQRSNGRPKPHTFIVLAIPAIVLVLVVPFSFGAYAWPVAATALACVWAFVLPTHDDRRRLAWRAGVAAMIAAAFVSIARQFDHPVKLPSATLTFAERQVIGVLVTASPDTVVIGAKGSLQTFPRDRIRTVDIGQALDHRSPPSSLLSRLLGGDAWAATPVEFWCGGESYGWERVGDMCQTQPKVLTRTAFFDGDDVRVQVACPEPASEGCSGFFTLTTAGDFAVHENSRKAPMRLGRVVFQAPPGGWVAVAVPIDDVERRCMRSVPQRVSLRAVLSSDLAADGILNTEQNQRVEVDFGSPKTQPRCSSTLPAAKDDPVTPGVGPPGDGDPPPDDDDQGGGNPPPEETPEPTPTPTATATPIPATPPDPGDDFTVSPDEQSLAGE